MTTCVVAGRVFLRSESSAVQRFTAEHVEIIKGDDRARNNFRLAAASECKLTSFESGETFKRARSLAVISKQRVVEIHVRQAFRRRGVPEGHQSIRFFDRQWPQQHRIDDTEDRGVRANAEREREHRDRRERRPLHATHGMQNGYL